MSHDYSFWNRYTIGNIEFINKHKNHPHRLHFVDYVLSNNCSSVVEIGPGEMNEYQIIRKQKKVKYTIVDVSSVFLENCRQQYSEVETVESAMEDITLDKCKISSPYDMVYASSVLEHTRDLNAAVAALLSLGREFYFTLFKWKYKGKGLKPNYYETKKRWSTPFNIHNVAQLIEKHGDILEIFIMSSKGKISPVGMGSGIHRNGDRLIIRGRSNAV